MRIRINKGDLYTIPNILCYLRILLVPTFMILYLTAGENAIQHYIAVGVIALAGITDFLDGYIARHYNKVTEIGKLIDPLGDKLLQLAIAIVLVLRYDYMWALLGVFLIKEAVMVICDVILLSKNMKLNGAKWFGKLSTFVFYVVMVALLIIDTPKIQFGNPEVKEIIVVTLMLVSLAFLILSFILYIPVFFKMFKVAFGKKAPKAIEGDIIEEEKEVVSEEIEKNE